MKFILSFLITGAVLSASPSFNVQLGDHEFNHVTLHNSVMDNPKAFEYESPKMERPNFSPVQFDRRILVRDCPPDPGTPNVPTPEPATITLLGAGLVTAGLARRIRTKK